MRTFALIVLWTTSGLAHAGVSILDCRNWMIHLVSNLEKRINLPYASAALYGNFSRLPPKLRPVVHRPNNFTFTAEEAAQLQAAVQWALQNDLAHEGAMWRAVRENNAHALPLILATRFPNEAQKHVPPGTYKFRSRLAQRFLTHGSVGRANFEVLHELVVAGAKAHPESFYTRQPDLLVAALNAKTYSFDQMRIMEKLLFMRLAFDAGYTFPTELPWFTSFPQLNELTRDIVIKYWTNLMFPMNPAIESALELERNFELFAMILSKASELGLPKPSRLLITAAAADATKNLKVILDSGHFEGWERVRAVKVAVEKQHPKSLKLLLDSPGPRLDLQKEIETAQAQALELAMDGPANVSATVQEMLRYLYEYDQR